MNTVNTIFVMAAVSIGLFILNQAIELIKGIVRSSRARRAIRFLMAAEIKRNYASFNRLFSLLESLSDKRHALMARHELIPAKAGGYICRLTFRVSEKQERTTDYRLPEFYFDAYGHHSRELGQLDKKAFLLVEGLYEELSVFASVQDLLIEFIDESDLLRRFRGIVKEKWKVLQDFYGKRQEYDNAFKETYEALTKKELTWDATKDIYPLEVTGHAWTWTRPVTDEVE